jgi:hypothetical protein
MRAANPKKRIKGETHILWCLSGAYTICGLQFSVVQLSYHKNFAGFALLSLVFFLMCSGQEKPARQRAPSKACSMWGDLKRLRSAEERLDALEREMKAIQLEWSNVYDKVRTTLAKLAKREERAAKEEPEPNVISGSQTPTSLTPRAQEVQRQILARRNRLPQNGSEQHGLLQPDQSNR